MGASGAVEKAPFDFSASSSCAVVITSIKELYSVIVGGAIAHSFAPPISTPNAENVLSRQAVFGGDARGSFVVLQCRLLSIEFVTQCRNR